MDVACSDPTIPDCDIWRIYYCKSYLQVKWTSNLCTADGSKVLPLLKSGHHSIWQSYSRNEEIIQERLYNKTWTIWRNFLCLHICDKQWNVSIELGNWKVKANDSDQLWPFYYSQQTDTLYKSYQKKWFSHIEYEYNALRGDLPDTYAFATLHKLSILPYDPATCNFKDIEHGWKVLDYQPMQSSSPPIAY